MEKEWLHVVITGSSINDDIINSDYFIKLLDDNKLRFLKDVDKTGYGLIYETTLTSGRKTEENQKPQSGWLASYRRFNPTTSWI